MSSARTRQAGQSAVTLRQQAIGTHGRLESPRAWKAGGGAWQWEVLQLCLGREGLGGGPVTAHSQHRNLLMKR